MYLRSCWNYRNVERDDTYAHKRAPRRSLRAKGFRPQLQTRSRTGPPEKRSPADAWQGASGAITKSSHDNANHSTRPVVPTIAGTWVQLGDAAAVLLARLARRADR